MNSLLDEVERSRRRRRPELTHEQRKGSAATFERIRDWFDQEFDRDGARGLAVFAASLDNLWCRCR